MKKVEEEEEREGGRRGEGKEGGRRPLETIKELNESEKIEGEVGEEGGDK